MDVDFVDVWEDFGPLTAKGNYKKYALIRRYAIFRASKQQKKPCVLASPTFKESIDSTRSAISPNLSGDSGFQSTYDNN